MILNFQNMKSLLMGFLVVFNFVTTAQPDMINRPLQDTSQIAGEIISVKGTVAKRDGKPLQDVIVWFGMNNYEVTRTDQEGHFQFELIPSNALLWFRYVGMKSICMKPDENHQMKITLDYDTLRIGVVTVSTIAQLPPQQIRLKDDPNPPLFLLDGVQITKSEMDSLDYKSVESFIIIKNREAIKLYGEKGKNGVIRMVSRSAEDRKRLTDQIEHVFSDGLVEPRFPGGEIALRDFIKKELTYPEEALKGKIQGKVYITFHISLIGKVENARIIRGVHPLLDEEAIRIVSKIPDWEPGHLYGKPWSTSYTIPIKFSLPDPVPNCSDTVKHSLSDPLPNHTFPKSSQERRRLWAEKQKQTEKEIVDDFSAFPEFPGGEEGIRRYFLAEIRKSEVAIRDYVQDTLLVSFAVNGYGKAERVNIIQGLHSILDEEVLRIIRAMPYWKPGNQVGNKNVDVIYTLPVKFVIN